MNSVYRDIFRAMHEGKWLSIEYCNKQNQITKYWIAICDLNIANKTLSVQGLHLSEYTIEKYEHIYIDSIQTSKIIEGTYYPVNTKLVNDIYINPHKYKKLFDNVANLKILSYLEMCNRLDAVPYHLDYALISSLDRESFQGEDYRLNDTQFRSIVKKFQLKAERTQTINQRVSIQQLGINILSIHTKKGLYVLAYKKLQLDVKQHILHPDKEITICTEYMINETKESIRKYMDGDDYELLEHFEKNQEKIKDALTKYNKSVSGIDDMPYIIGLGTDHAIDLHKEYNAIMNMYQTDTVTEPIKAFFGDLLNRPIRRIARPMALIDTKVNLDQLLAINNAMKYPLAYIQGPPGTGKTSTIINTMITAFFNEKTVLFASYNNHPINGVCEKLTQMEYNGNRIPFPVLRLGNHAMTGTALVYMKKLYEQTKTITVYEKTLNKNKDDRTERAKKLSELLKRYEEVLDLKERKETLNKLLENERKNVVWGQGFTFQADLEGRQKQQIEKNISQIGEITETEALSLLDDDKEELKKYLYYTSAKYIKKIDFPANAELKNIILDDENEEQIKNLNKYLSKKENIKKLQKIFPIIVTTCISAHKLGEPEPMFDMVILDEASQCNTAVSLVPVIRGESLMLVGDPQQLSPVILLNEMVNQKLRKKYNISDEYDYCKNSIYKTYLACDSVSDEVLLRYHYRCNEKIIGFNNKKYYNSKLCVRSQSKETTPLIYIDVPVSRSAEKNTAPEEITEIVNYAETYMDKQIGVITPFVSQRKLIEEELRNRNLDHIFCGTVHSFQGDEKDVIMFSTAITEQTQAKTYEWLKNNKELINVATSRAKERLILFSNMESLKRLHREEGEDDLYELVEYVRTNGESIVTQKKTNSRALGVKPFSTLTEDAFLQNLNHALGNIGLSSNRLVIQKEVPIAQVFQSNTTYEDLFYTGRFDFVVYERMGLQDIPMLAIELDGKEHFENEIVVQRDRKKNAICKAHDMQIIRVENSYARRYNYIKDILISYFSLKK